MRGFRPYQIVPGLIAVALLGVVAWALLRSTIEPTSQTGSDELAVAVPEQLELSTVTPANPGPQLLGGNHREDEWTIRWRELSALAETPDRNEAMIDLLEKLAASNPSRALLLVQSVTNADLQTELLQATARGWGGADATAAAAWAMSQASIDQGLALASVFHGAVQDPENGKRLASELSERDPDHAADYGSYLVAALDRVGDFSQAARFAAAGDPEVRIDWLNAAYSRWAATDPDAALKEIETISDPEVRRAAFDAASSHAAEKNPKQFAEYAMTLPEGRDRDFALTAALREWSAQDAAAAADWINHLEPSSMLDQGVAVVALQSVGVQQPQIATTWAESIVDQTLRVRVLASLINEWSMLDPIAARSYAEFSPAIRPDDRAAVLAAFDPDFVPMSILP